MLALLALVILWLPESAQAQQATDTAPRFTSSATPSVAENQTAVITVTAVDDDTQDTAHPPTFMLAGGADQSKFSITSAGVLTFKDKPNFENPKDALSTDPANAAKNNEYVVSVRATSGTGDRQRSEDQDIVVTVTDANDAPTGKPTITGIVRVDGTLTAGTSVIYDEDGTTTPGWTYQWKRVDTSTNPATVTDISGATGQTYVLQADDQNKKVRVTVSFTDDNSNSHSLTSDDTPAVADRRATIPDSVQSYRPTVGDELLTLTWEKSTPTNLKPFTHYRVYLHPPTGPRQHRDVTDVNTTSYTWTGLTNGQSYEIYMVVCNGIGCSVYMGRWTASPSAARPTAVQGYQPTTGNESITWTWDKYVNEVDRAPFDRYHPRLNDEDCDGYLHCVDNGTAITDINTTTITWTGLTNGKRYSVGKPSSGEPHYPNLYVDVCNGESIVANCTNILGYWIVTPYSDVGRPTGLTAEGGNAQVTLRWNANAGATGWDYCQSQSRNCRGAGLFGDDWSDIANSDNTTVSHTATGLQNGTTYYFKVRAENVNGPGEESIEVAATPGLGAAPSFTSAATKSVAENQTAVMTVTATDDDAGDTVTFALADTGSADQDKFSITSTGVLTFKVAPNFEDPQDVLSVAPSNAAENNQYMVAVRATSGTGAHRRTTDQTITVTVTDANDAPTGKPTISGTVQVDQFVTAVTTGIADEDGLTTPGYTYQWKRVDGGTATNISGATESTYILAPADEGKKVRVTVSFTDDNSNSHSLDSDDTTAVTMSRFSSLPTFSVAENQTAVGTVVARDDDLSDSIVPTYALHRSADRDKFQVTTAGVLTFKTAPNFESPADVESTTPADAAGNNVYIVTVRAVIGAARMTADQTIRVTVTDINDAPTGLPTISGTAQQSQTLTAVTTGIADEDGLTTPGWTYQWKRVDESTNPDTITNLATTSTYQLKAADVGKKIRLTVGFTDDNSNSHSLTSADTAAIISSDTAPPVHQRRRQDHRREPRPP